MFQNQFLDQAVAVASTITDRLCIHSGGRIGTHISEQDLLTCCTNCGSGCDGGDPAEAWKYWKKYGIVSGGAYGSAQVKITWIYLNNFDWRLKKSKINKNLNRCIEYKLIKQDVINKKLVLANRFGGI